MKRAIGFLLAGVMFVMIAQPAAAQLHVSAIKLGYLNPKDTKAGFIIGTEISDYVDESVSVGLSVNLFRKTFIAETAVAERNFESGVRETTIQRELEFNTTFIPLMGQATVNIPSSGNLGWYVGGGLGYEFLWNNEKNFTSQPVTSDRRFYKGFAWLLDAGLRYRVGSRSSLLLEAFYHNSAVKRNKTNSPAGLPVWSEVDLSGLGFRFGLGFGGW
jgi:hypothetical protein